MGYSTPKTPFNLADFLSQKSSSRSHRKPVWSRKTVAPSWTETPPRAADADAATAPADVHRVLEPAEGAESDLPLTDPVKAPVPSI